MSKRMIKRTIKVLEERGWTQHIEEDNEGKMCLLGALNVAATGEAEPRATLLTSEYNNTLIDIGNSVAPMDMRSEYLNDEAREQIAHWNDRKSRRKSDVINKLKGLL